MEQTNVLPQNVLKSFDEFHNQYLSGKTDEVVLQLAESELLKYYNNRIPGAEPLDLLFEIHNANYEKLENFVLQLSLKIIADTDFTIIPDYINTDDLIVFREYLYRGFQNLNEKEVVAVLRKTVSGLNLNPDKIDMFMKYFTPFQYPFFVLLYIHLISDQDFSTVFSRILSPKFCSCIDLPIVHLHLWDHQERALDKCINSSGGIISMAPATGKTVVALSIIEKTFQEKRKKGGFLTVLILTPSKILLNQWRSDAIQQLGLVRIDAADSNNPIEVPNLKIVFETYLDTTKNPNHYADLDLVIYDEAQKLNNSQLKQVLDIPCEKKIGLSTTVDDQIEQVGQDYEKIIFSYNLSDALKDGVLSRFELVLYPTLELPDPEPGFELLAQDFNDPSPLVQNASSSETYFDNFLIRMSAELQNSKSVIFCDSFSDCKLIYDKLNRADEVTIINPESEFDSIQAVLQKFKNRQNGALISPGSFDEGVNIPDISLGFNITKVNCPSEFIRRVGRILRRGEGKSPIFHHRIGIPSNSLTINDSITFQSQLSWFFDFALRNGIALKINKPNESLLLDKINQSEDFLVNFAKGEEIPLPFGERLAIKLITTNIEQNLRDKIINSLESESKPVSDERWLELIRESAGIDQIAIRNLRWILLSGERDPRKITKILLKNDPVQNILRGLNKVEETACNIDNLCREISGRFNELKSDYLLLTGLTGEIRSNNQKVKEDIAILSPHVIILENLFRSIQASISDMQYETTQKNQLILNEIKVFRNELSQQSDTTKSSADNFSAVISQNISDQFKRQINLIQSMIESGHSRVAQLIHESSDNILNSFIPVFESLMIKNVEPVMDHIQQQNENIQQRIEQIHENTILIRKRITSVERLKGQMRLGSLLYKNKQYEGAREILEWVVTQNPDDHRAWNTLGATYVKLKLSSDAERCFRNATLLDPENEVYSVNMERNHKNLESTKKQSENFLKRKMGFWPFNKS